MRVQELTHIHTCPRTHSHPCVCKSSLTSMRCRPEHVFPVRAHMNGLSSHVMRVLSSWRVGSCRSAVSEQVSCL